MENQTQGTAIAEQPVDNKQYQTFNPKEELLLNVFPAYAEKIAVKPMKKQMPAGKQEESPGKLLQGLLLSTPASAKRTQFAKRKWQLVSMLTGILLVASFAIIGWLYMETSATATLRGQLEVENQSFREQADLDSSQITELKNDMEELLDRNIELTTENAKLKSHTITPVVTVSPKPEQKTTESNPSAASVDASQIDVMRQKTYTNGATKAQLIAIMGKPDCVYNARGYEQLVYFGKKPGRFWLIGERVVQVGG